ncbi:hypothetical protein CUMW_282320 [Citrus unshiu]|uniref:Cupin type-1 domain-containing protein n=1 Tax=Citrus unshiu TaxID=55188 RepID=A0A2H5N133_CITUN|nr:hypothetical protein CUMW_282320 [Citrus unshiu]
MCFLLRILAVTYSHVALAFEPKPLQNFCTRIAEAQVSPAVNVALSPGLNTPGISVPGIYYAPWSINPPHTDPRASEILTVITIASAVFGSNTLITSEVLSKVFQVDKKFVDQIQSKF